MSILPDTELEVLTTQALDELGIVLEDNPNLTEEEAIDWVYEIADNHTPINNFDVLVIASNNLGLVGYRDIPAGVLGDITPVEVARAAIFEYLKEILYAERHSHLRSKEE